MSGVPSGDASGRPWVHDRAWHLYHTGRYELGAEDCRAALGREPNCHMAHGLLALCLTYLSRLEEAEAAARESLRCRPNYAWPHYVLGTVLRSRRRYHEAELALREAIRLQPENVQFRSQLASVFIDEDLNEQALEVARDARRLDPTNAGPPSLEGLALEALGRLDEAEVAFRDALRLHPQNNTAHAGMGYLALRRLRGDGAAKAFQIALRNNPNYRWAESGLGDALRLQVPGYARMEAVESWLHRLSETQRSLLLAGSIVGFIALLISTPFTISRETKEPTILTVVLMGLFLIGPYGWAFAYWALRPLGELFLWLHPVGKWIVRRDRLRRAWLLSAMLVIGSVLALVGALATWKYGILAGINCLLAVPGMAAQFREPRPAKTGGERIYFGACLLLGLAPGSLGEMQVAMLGYVLLWPQVFYSAYLTIAKR